MSNWSAGYISDIGYTYGYFTELNPLSINLAFLNAGLIAPEVGTACELGFGQGLSINIHAAGSLHQWHGTDFIPAQAGFAQELAAASGAKIKLFDDSFLDYANRQDLPDFDFISLHGIWSWVSDENRAVIVDFIRRKLKVGGVLYISYNTQPGWASFAPMRHLMTEHTEVMGVAGNGISSQISGAMKFTEKLLATNPLYARANPLVSERIKSLKDQTAHYLAHEYFNRDWKPMHYSEMAQWLEPAKLSYACSANYLENIDQINLSQEQQNFIKEIPDPGFRESVRDFMINQQFRRDYWVKGKRNYSNLDRAESLRAQRVILTAFRGDISLKVKGALGDADMSEAIYNPILELMSDYKARTFAQMEGLLKSSGIDYLKLIQAVMILKGCGHLAPVNEDAVIAKAKGQTSRLNSHLMHIARSNKDINYLASPVTGGAVAVNRFQKLFLLAITQNKKQPAEWAQSAWEILNLQGEKLVKEGKALETTEENLAQLNSLATKFSDETLPILKALQVI